MAKRKAKADSPASPHKWMPIDLAEVEAWGLVNGKEVLVVAWSIEAGKYDHLTHVKYAGMGTITRRMDNGIDVPVKPHPKVHIWTTAKK